MRRSRYILAALAVTLCCATLLGAEHPRGRDNLKNLKGAAVSVDFNDAAAKLLPRSQFESRLELTLRKAGFKVLDIQTAVKELGFPVIEFHADAISSEDRESVVFTVNFWLRESS